MKLATRTKAGTGVGGGGVGERNRLRRDATKASIVYPQLIHFGYQNEVQLNTCVEERTRRSRKGAKTAPVFLRLSRFFAAKLLGKLLGAREDSTP